MPSPFGMKALGNQIFASQSLAVTRLEQTMDQIKLNNIFRNALKMTDQDAEELDTKIQSLATKDDLKDLKMELFMALNTLHPPNAVAQTVSPASRKVYSSRSHQNSKFPYYPYSEAR